MSALESVALRSVVYVSDARHALSVDALESLLIEARALNHKSGITGVLLYSGGNFMQCFEGPGDAMAGTYERIRRSRRHHNLIELMNEPVAERSFQQWDMGLAQPSRSELLALSTARWKAVAARPGPAGSSPAGLSLLRNFWDTARP